MIAESDAYDNNLSISYGFDFFDEDSVTWCFVVVRVGAGKDLKCTFDIPSKKTSDAGEAGGSNGERSLKRLCYPMISEDPHSRSVKYASSFQVDIRPEKLVWRILPSRATSYCCDQDGEGEATAVIGFVCPVEIQKALDDLADASEDSDERSAFYRVSKKTRRDAELEKVPSDENIA